ncbi:hypothetical protein POM88_008448 [Heracleum sosnowskyi]|uniref:DNA helicase n=1 Tax=Heracleum sosnowskyi TaxID=360622 RepID=A0AAD8J671_9APIA|nr:hypothetical protein POM88_008448 [Heracleum sosnowskyi]
MEGLRNQGSTLSTKDRRTEPLLSNVFNYELGMMKERNHRPNITNAFPPLTPITTTSTTSRIFKSKTQKRKPQKQKTNMTNMSPHTPRQNCSNTAAVKSRTPLSPLSTNTLPSTNIKFSPQSHFSPNVPFPSQVPVDLSSYWPKEKVFSGKATKSQNSNTASYLSNKSKGKRPIEDVEMPCKKLGFDESQTIQSTAHHTYDLEDSCFYDFQHEDSDASSEDEDFTADLNYDSYANQEMPLNVVKDYASLGAPDVQCQHCHAWMWKEERSNKSVTCGIPVFSLCCAKGQIQLPNEEPTPSFIWQLHNDKAKAKRFNDGRNEEEVQSLATFAKWVLDIGDGKIKSPSNAPVQMVEDDICIPKQFCNLHGINSVDEMIESNFPDLLDNFQNPKYLSERAILSPTNQTVGHVNSSIVEKLPGEMFSYFSIDTAKDFPEMHKQFSTLSTMH